MRILAEVEPDVRLVQLGWWFVCGIAIVLDLGIIWFPIFLFGTKVMLWTIPQLWTGGGAFLLAIMADFLWKRWSRPRWERWIISRANELDKVRVQAMYDGTLKKDRDFIDAYWERIGAAGTTE